VLRFELRHPLAQLDLVPKRPPAVEVSNWISARIDRASAPVRSTIAPSG
jgi:hypothetical protein